MRGGGNSGMLIIFFIILLVIIAGGYYFLIYKKANSGTTAPGTTAPGTTAQGTTASGTTAPGTTASVTTVSGTTAPGTTVPMTTKSVTTAPVTTAPEIGTPQFKRCPGGTSMRMTNGNRYLYPACSSNGFDVFNEVLVCPDGKELRDGLCWNSKGTPPIMRCPDDTVDNGKDCVGTKIFQGSVPPYDNGKVYAVDDSVMYIDNNIYTMIDSIGSAGYPPPRPTNWKLIGKKVVVPYNNRKVYTIGDRVMYNDNNIYMMFEALGDAGYPPPRPSNWKLDDPIKVKVIKNKEPRCPDGKELRDGLCWFSWRTP